MNLGMMKQAMEMRSKLEKAQKDLAKKTVEVESGKGAVKVVANGQLRIMSIKIAPEAIDPKKLGDLEKLVLKAVDDALDQAQEMAAKELEPITKGLKLPGLT
jgi:DNA-binding YbaB/EbfC family protein